MIVNGTSPHNYCQEGQPSYFSASRSVLTSMTQWGNSPDRFWIWLVTELSKSPVWGEVVDETTGISVIKQVGLVVI